MIAGPNGSGKSTLIELLKNIVDIGVYINADDIEASLNKKPVIHLSDYNINATTKDFSIFVNKKETIGTASFKKKLLTGYSIEANVLVLKPVLINSYVASLIADFIRHKLLEKKENFTFETVMSHSSKLSIIDIANKEKYRTYLYFVTTIDPKLNIERIKNRVKKGGHNVSPEKAIERFYRSISHLPEAIKRSYRAFVFDNTTSLKLIGEFHKGKIVSDAVAFESFIKRIGQR